MNVIKHGFEPVYNENSKVLILGSFPSVKSRETDFYYGHPQNRFWRILAQFFCVDKPVTKEEKIQLILNNNLALWDVVSECEIVGSQDSTIKNFKVADLKKILQNSPIKFIILNGIKAYDIFYRYFGNISVHFEKLPSTSSANTLFDVEIWYDALRRALITNN